MPSPVLSSTQPRRIALLRVASGPAAFAAVYFLASQTLPSELVRISAVFAWCVLWWVTRPIPWAITAVLPFVALPTLGVMSVGATAELYGQQIFFWVLGMAMFARAIEKHGLAKRFALSILRFDVVAATTPRLAFGFMLATAFVSMFVSDAAAVAIMLPIGVSIATYLGRSQASGDDRSRAALAGFFALGALCASVAGGLGTVTGLPHNALAVSIHASLTGRTIGWLNWMAVGVPLSLVSLASYYALLRVFFGSSGPITNSRRFIHAERAKLGPLSRGEVNTIIVFGVMTSLFMLPPILGLVLGGDRAFVVYVQTHLSIWVVPPIVALLLFLLPVDLRRAEGTLAWSDLTEHVPWNVILLCTSAVALTDALVQHGFTDFITGQLEGLRVSATALPFLAALTMGLVTNVVSGIAATSLLCDAFIPLAEKVGFDSASMAMLIANNALGTVFPWAGAAGATAFATGYVDLKQMIKVGAVGTVVLAALTASAHLMFARLL